MATSACLPRADNSGRFAALNFDQYANRLEVTVTEGGLEGRYGREGRWYPFRAHPRAGASSVSAADVPDISGLWEIPTKSPKGEAAWRFIVRQQGADSICCDPARRRRYGRAHRHWRDGKFVLSHFSGARPNLLEVTPAADGTLKIVQNGRTTLAALRPASARAQGLGEPTDPFHHTGVKDASAPLTWPSPISRAAPSLSAMRGSAAKWWCWRSPAVGARTATTKRHFWKTSIASIGIRDSKWLPFPLKRRSS